MASTRTPFEKLTPIYPHKRITLETGATPIAPRLMDLFVPIGFGQRALIVAPPQASKTSICARLPLPSQELSTGQPLLVLVNQKSGTIIYY